MMKILAILCALTHLAALFLGCWGSWLRVTAESEIQRSEALGAIVMSYMVLFMAVVGWNGLDAPWWALVLSIALTVGIALVLVPMVARRLLERAPKESLTGETDPG